MSEFIREVDEEYRHDRIRNVLNRYWILIGTVLVLILVGVAAYKTITYFTQQKAEAAGARYLDASDLGRTDPAAALPALDALGKDGPSGYGLLARFRAAGLTGKTDAAAGIKAFDALAEDAAIDPDLKDVARLRAALLAMDTADGPDVHRRLDPLADANGTYRNVAREMLALLALKAGDNTQAGHQIEAIQADAAATPDQRQRATLYQGLIRSGTPAPPKP